LISSPVPSSTFPGASNTDAAARARRAADRRADTRTLIVRSGDGRNSTGDGGPSDSSNANAGAYSVCERRCLDGWGGTTSGVSADAFGVVLSSAGRGEANAGAGGASGNDVGALRGDRATEAAELKCSLGSSETVIHVPVAFAFAGSASRCTMRFARFFRGFALVAAERSGDGWCDEGAGENTGLLEELAPLDGAGTAAVIGAVVAGAAAAIFTSATEKKKKNNEAQ